MANPLLLLTSRNYHRGDRTPLRRAKVDIPRDVPSTDAVFLVLRRMRGPLIALIVVFAIAVAGMSLMPGVDDAGHPTRMTVFESFYVMSYTATTIGFGEVPHAFTTAQRLWMTGSIFATVTGWAYSLGALFSLVQDPAFRQAIATQRFARKVERLGEPFVLVGGYGQTGRAVCRVLDELGRRVVVVEDDRARLDLLASDQLAADVPGLDGDVRNPALLGLAGLGHRRCEGVLALTNDDDANLSVVMSAHLLRPDLPVIARCSERATAAHMRDFQAHAVINPYDNYGQYLVLALRRPAVHRLVSWLMAPHGSTLPPLREGLADGRWVVAADGRFGREVAEDLRRAGLDVTLVDPADEIPDVTDAAGFVAGAEGDSTNLSLAANARLSNPDVFISLRQRSDTNASLLAAFDPDSVFVPTDLVARESLARILSPWGWRFIEEAMTQDDAWAARVTDALVAAVGEVTPTTWRVELNGRSAPAVFRWLSTHDLSLGDLLRDPDDRDGRVAALPLVLVRGDDATFLPGDETPLQRGDTLVLAGRTRGFDALSATLFGDAALEYVATGDAVPTTWLWRRLRRGRGPGPRHDPDRQAGDRSGPGA